MIDPIVARLHARPQIAGRFDSFRVVESYAGLAGREAPAGVVQQTVSELDFAFAAYAGEHFSRTERTAAEPRFKTALTPSDRNE